MSLQKIKDKLYHVSSASLVNISKDRVKSITVVYRPLKDIPIEIVVSALSSLESIITGSNAINHWALLITTDSGYYISEFMNDGKVHSYEIKVKGQITSTKNGIQFSERDFIWNENSFVSKIVMKDEFFTVDEICDIMNEVATFKNYKIDEWNCVSAAYTARILIEKLAQNQSYSYENEISDNPELVFMAKISRNWKHNVGIGPNLHYALLFARTSSKNFEYIIVEFQNNSLVKAYLTTIKDEPTNLMEWNQFQDDNNYTWSIIQKCYLLEEKISLKMIKEEILDHGDHNIIRNNCKLVIENTYNSFKQELSIPKQGFNKNAVIKQIHSIYRVWAKESRYYHFAILLITELNSTINYYIVEYLYNNRVICYEIKVKEKVQNEIKLYHIKERSYIWNGGEQIRIDLKFLNIKIEHIISIMKEIACNKKFFHLINNNCRKVTEETEEYLYSLKKNYLDQITKSTNTIISQDILQQTVHSFFIFQKTWDHVLEQEIYILYLNNEYYIEYIPNGSIILETKLQKFKEHPKYLFFDPSDLEEVDVPPNTTISQIIQLMKDIAKKYSFSVFENNTKKICQETILALKKKQKSKPKEFFSNNFFNLIDTSYLGLSIEQTNKFYFGSKI